MTMLVLVLLASCACRPGRSVGRIERKLSVKISEVCRHPNTCTIRLTEITDFNWDKMYIFRVGATHDDINKALNTPLPVYTEFTRKLIFIRESKIIYREDWPSTMDGLENGDMVFSMPVDKFYAELTPDTAEFEVAEKPLTNGIYYELKQVK